jgi:predicted DNA-binding transcriptional regulator AlpA
VTVFFYFFLFYIVTLINNIKGYTMSVTERKANPEQAAQHQIKFIRWPAVHEICAVSRSHVQELMAKGKFPQSVKLCGSRASGWVLSEVEEWAKERMDSRNSDAA